MFNRTSQFFCIVFCFIVGAGGAQGQSQVETSSSLSPPDWEGLWVAEKSFGPNFKGPVTLHRLDSGWIARLQGETVAVERKDEAGGAIAWSFAFPEEGRFVGLQARAGAAIEGHWLQVPGVVQGYPFATPVRLAPVGGDAFDGDIAPFPQEVSLNIPLIPEATSEDGAAATYRTFLRNPQRNLGIWFPIETAVVEGEEIRFTNADGEVLAVGRSIDPGERFTLLFPRFGETFDFTRRSREDAPGFYPRRSPNIPAALPRPVEIEDGWRTAAPGPSGLDEDLLRELVGSIAAFEPTGLREPQIHGLLLAHRGKLVLEEYFHGYHRNIPHDSRSAGKSLTSALLGIAIRNGAISSVDEPVYPLFGGVDRYANPDPRKAQMTVRHLATMSPGFDCDDTNYDTPGHEDRMQSQEEEPDWYRYTLDLPMAHAPGEKGAYCTAGLNLIGGVIQEATGMSLKRFFHDAFAKPMNISYYQMNLSPTYEAYMGGGIRLRPRDFLKLGQLYLDDGVWNGRRIVSKDWVRESAAPHASLNEDDDYGFAWWRRSYDVGGQTVETFYASGNGGQLLFVVPDLDLVALIQAGNYSDGRTRNSFRDRFMREAILPAALAAQ